MTTESRIPTVEEAATVGFKDAYEALGIGKTAAYRMAPTGQLADGVPVIRVGGQYRVPTAPLRRVLELDEPAPAAS